MIPALADRETEARHAARSCSQPSKRQTKATGAPLLLPLQPQPPPAPKLLWRSKIASATPRMEPDSPPAPAALRRPLSLRGSPARWHLCHSGGDRGAGLGLGSSRVPSAAEVAWGRGGKLGVCNLLSQGSAAPLSVPGRRGANLAEKFTPTEEHGRDVPCSQPAIGSLQKPASERAS